MPETAGYVLVGGKSSRFGPDKALLEWQGRPLASHVAAAVRSAAGSVTLIGSPAKYSHLSFRVIPDPVEDFGPLAGLLAALDDSASAWNLVTACDMPCLTPRFLGFLLAQAQESKADILLPFDDAGMPQPLCAVYALRSRETIRREVGRGVRKMTSAFQTLSVRTLQPEQYAKFNPDGKLFTNLNCPEDVGAVRLT